MNILSDTNWRDLIIPTIILLIAAVTRFYGFWTWPLYGDELFTIRDSLKADFLHSIKPGIYVLVAVMFKFFGVSEWTARLPAVIFGIFSVIAFYYMAKRFEGRYAATCGSVFIILSGWHLYHSQSSRFYTAVFLFGILSYFYYYEAYRLGQPKYLVYAFISNGLGILFHTTFFVVPLSCCAFSFLVLIVKPLQNSYHCKRIAKYYLMPYLLASLLLIPFAFRVLGNWYFKGKLWGYGPLYLSLAIIKYLSIPICVTAFFGLIQLLRKDIFKGSFIGIAILVPIISLILLSFFVDVRPDYIFFSAPLFFLLSGYTCAELSRIVSPRRLAPLVIVFLVATTMFPEFISYYTNKATLDVRDAIHFVGKNYKNGDKIVNFQNGFAYYWKENYPLEDWLGNPRDSNVDWYQKLKLYEKTDQRAWFIITVYRVGLAHNFQKWLLENANLVWEKQAKRYDYSTETIRIFLKK